MDRWLGIEMGNTYNIYCDESCHLENDGQKSMVIGSVWCSQNERLNISKRIREIKKKHHLPSNFEIKWTKVSQSKLQFYLEIVDYFFDDDDMHFRAVVIPDKNGLDHERYSQNHDDWYYKMFFVLLKNIFEPNNRYRIYIDIKDTLGQEKINKLHDVLCNHSYDFSKKMIEDVKRIRSHEAEQLQVADLLIGALSYQHRHLHENSAKLELINRIKDRSGYTLARSTLAKENKFNLLIWERNRYA